MRLLAFFKREAVLTVAALCALATMVLCRRTPPIWATSTCGCYACCCA